MEILNFNAGPSYIDKTVMSQAIDFIDNSKKVGGLEISHRGKEIKSLFNETKQLIKELMQLEDRYEVLFLHGGARLQNCMIPYNIKLNKKAYYIDSGIWSQNSLTEASIIRECEILASSAKDNYSYIPKNVGWTEVSSDAGYLHLTSNNTVHGSQFFDFSEFKTGTVIADMSSDILSRDINYNQFGIIYAGLQKNLGTAGGSLVVIDKNLIDYSLKIPSMLNYGAHINADSMLNTPPVFPVLLCNLVLKWIKSEGGIKQIENNNKAKAKLLYDEIDRNELFEGFVKKEDRSIMNATFKLKDEHLEESFNKYLDSNGVIGYRGHRSKGGYRVSMYNMLPILHVERFVQLIKDFKA